MSNEAMVFATAVILMVLIFVAVIWIARMDYRYRARDQAIAETELYDKSHRR